MEHSAPIGESAEFFSDNEVAHRLKDVDTLVQPALTLKWVHLFLSGAITLTMLWSIYTHVHSVAALIFAVFATVAVFFDLVLAGILQLQASHYVSTYERVLRLPRDNMTMESRAASVYYASHNNLEFLRRNGRREFSNPLWTTDPYIQLLRRYVWRFQILCSTPSFLCALEVAAITPWLLFYHIFGFYVSMFIWSYRAIRFAASTSQGTQHDYSRELQETSRPGSVLPYVHASSV